MTWPCASWLSVTSPSFIVPTYSLSSLISRSWILVPFPIVMSRRPVASGSSVPQCPTFFVFNERLVIATASCDVMSCDLSTRRTPLTSVPDFIAYCIQKFLLCVRKRPRHAGSGRERVSTAAKQSANAANVHARVLERELTRTIPPGNSSKNTAATIPSTERR